MSKILSSVFRKKDKDSKSKDAPPKTRSSIVNTNGATKAPAPKETAPAVSEPKVIEFNEPSAQGSGISLQTISAAVDAFRHKESIDDRKMLLEHGISIVSRMKPGELANSTQDKIVELCEKALSIIHLLYNDLAHPPATSIGNKYAFRTADGSFNNIEMPDLGKAGTTYARSVQQSHPLPQNQLPDPGLVFDTLLRREGFVKHPAGLSSMMFSFAALVIHSVFRTSHTDVNINETSSYVDLSPLYGHNQEAQDRVRMRDGRGLLYPDVFAEDRLLLLPPAVCALLVLFSRNHNYIAKRLLEINERGTWVDPSTLSPDIPANKAKLISQEEEIFQIARLVNCGWFGAVVFSDYFSCILGLVRDGSSWSLNPFEEIRNADHSLFERGKGNVCSVEFNCLYRWHATTSVEDEKWVHQVFDQIFDGKDPEAVSVTDFKMAARKIQAMQPDIHHWTFGNLKRQEDGSFRDEDLANILHNATEHPAGAFRARGTPSVMRLHEIMGIEQNRRWGVCSLNDFRKYLGIKPYATFLEWNSDPEIAEAAESLYGSIDYLELYVGLQAEEAKPVMDGAGLCPGYTISRAILSDAIALTRGDRFFTHDFTPYNLTAWGFNDCQRDPNAFGFGSTLGRLILRTLPENFTENSTYTFFPLMTPESMKIHLTKLNVIDQYDLTRPTTTTAPRKIQDYGVIAEILKKPNGWAEPYNARVARVIHGKGFYAAEGVEVRRQVVNALAGSPEAIDKIGKSFYEATRKLINSRAATLVGGKAKAVDLVREVFRVAPVQWVATNIAGLSIKTKTDPDGDYTADELFDMLGDIYSFVFLDVEASKAMVLQRAAHAAIHRLTESIKGPLGSGVSTGFVAEIASHIGKAKKAEHGELVRKLEALGYSSDQIVNTILALMVVASVELSLAFTNVVHLYLDSKDEPTIRTLARSTDAKDVEKLNAYVYEALRLEPVFRGVYREASTDQQISHTYVKANTRVFLDLAQANRNEQAFPNANNVDTRRTIDTILHGDGLFRNLGEALTIKITTQVLRAVYSYDNVNRAPGDSGRLQRFVDHTRPELNYAYLDKSQVVSPWPRSLTVKYDVAA
ncbi:linoleate diol synthase [Pluteus cervinus]|uniref:Linoleate diol synthase n=1 Tax=Pluteus cervinus TaxID=181527 RepID=A0ACD3AJ98_9AGAR|nr:linoleate diol synthase [Pluteus cervinus]